MINSTAPRPSSINHSCSADGGVARRDSNLLTGIKVNVKSTITILFRSNHSAVSAMLGAVLPFVTFISTLVNVVVTSNLNS